jgi:hypothetical protein
LRSEKGQSLIMVLITLPVLLGMMGLVVDGAHAFGEKRRTQNAADAAALAAAQNLIGSLSSACPAGPPPVNNLKKAAECYSEVNDGPSVLHQCSDRDASGFPIPGAPEDNNCYTNPYKGDSFLVEVRLKRSIDEFFLDLVGLGGLLDEVSGRAVASALPQVSPPTTQTTVDPGTTETIIQDGTTQTITDPDTTNVQTITNDDGVQGAQAFLMSPACNAISYEGAGGGRIESLATNGGLTFQGSSPKKVRRLGTNRSHCGSAPASPPSGTGSCTSTNWGDPTESNNMCVKQLIDLSARYPLNWPVPPPPLPTPLPVGTTWNASTHYANNCILLATAGNGIKLTAPPATPGVYCVSGDVTLTISNSMTAGDGYTFFALNGARIEIASNSTSVKFYWPSACGPRPTTRLLSFSCFGRTIAGYDPLTVLYSTNSTPFPNKCSTSAICFNGQGGSLEGDVFAPLPNNFPPTANQGGGTVWIAGGAASAGDGFIEAWQLVIEGNGGSYVGTGPGIGGSISTITTTTPGGTTTIITPGTTYTNTVPPSTSTTTTPGSTTGIQPGLDE